MQIKRLDKNMITALTELSGAEGFPYRLNEREATDYCRGDLTADEGLLTYGAFDKDKLVSIAAATFCRVFPHHDSPHGRIVHISGVYTLPEYRHRQCASKLLEAIENDAKKYKADYICCDSTANELYLSNGFKPAPAGETRMWKQITGKEEVQL